MSSPLVYRVLDRSTGADKGLMVFGGSSTPAVVGVDAQGTEPTFVSRLNDGMGAITLKLACAVAAVTNLAPLDLVQIEHPDTRIMGRWKYEKHELDDSQDDADVLTLMPLSSELGGTEFVGNYTDTGDTSFPALGVHAFSQPVTDAIALTKHLSAGTVNNDGHTYALDYRDLKARDTLDKAVAIGGPDWWWRCSGTGVIDLEQGGDGATVDLDYPTQIENMKTAADYQTIFNRQTVQGGSALDGFGFPTQLMSTQAITGGTYGTTAIGQLSAPRWYDPSVKDQATLDQLAIALLQREQIPLQTFECRLLPVDTDGAPVPRLRPGMKVNISPVTSDVWVTEVAEEGSTLVQVIKCASVFGAFHANPGVAGSQFLSNFAYGGPPIGTGASGSGSTCAGEITFTEGGSTGSGSTIAVADGVVNIDLGAWILDSGGGCRVRANVDGALRMDSWAALSVAIAITTDVDGSPGTVVKQSQAIPVQGNAIWANFSRHVPVPNTGMTDGIYHTVLLISTDTDCTYDWYFDPTTVLL